MAEKTYIRQDGASFNIGLTPDEEHVEYVRCSADEMRCGWILDMEVCADEDEIRARLIEHMAYCPVTRSSN